MPQTANATVNIDFNADVITSQTTSTLVASILDLLLFDRKQIPFVYNTFKYMVEKLDALTGEEEDWDNYLIERERKLASKTLWNLKKLKRNIADELDAIDIDRVLILFGPNAMTPREAFEVHLPRVNRDHYGRNHTDSDNKLVRTVNMSLVGAAQHYESTPSCSQYLNQSTNVYVLLNPRKSETGCTGSTFQRHDEYELHPNCQTTVIRLRNMSSKEATTLNCCGDLIVYKDLSSLHLADDKKPVANVTLNPNNDRCGTETSTTWFESDVFVKGYKDKHVKGQSIWI